MVTPFVFLGPSLPLDEARRILPDAAYLPPVSMGDVHRLMSRRPAPRIIAIIDGLFEQTPAVWHKEILYALSRGVRVLGASSMGALRAAELAAFGMEGVGQVYAAFASGELEDDDEVAVAHASAAEGFRPLSDAMVSIRAGLKAAEAAGIVGAELRARLVAAVKALTYADRSWPRVLHEAAALGAPAPVVTALSELIARERPDVKRADAMHLLAQLAAGAPRKDAAPAFDFEPTYFWEQLILHESTSDGGGEGGGEDRGDEAVSLAELRRHVRLHPSRSREVLGAALLLYLAEEQASRRGLLLGEAATATGDVGQLGAGDRRLLATAQAAIAALAASLADQVNLKLPAALAHLGLLQPTLLAVRRKQAVLRSLGLRAASPADAGLAVDDLLAWYRQKFGAFQGSPEAHAAGEGFTSFEEFVGELALEYLSDRGGELASGVAGLRTSEHSAGAVGNPPKVPE